MGKISEQYLEDAHMEKRAYIQQVLELKAEVAELKRQLIQNMEWRHMGKIDGQTHGVCQEMVTSLQATIKGLQAQSQDLIDAIDNLAGIIEDDHYKCDITSNGDCDLMESGSWQVEYIHGSIRRAKQSIAKAKEVNNG